LWVKFFDLGVFDNLNRQSQVVIFVHVAVYDRFSGAETNCDGSDQGEAILKKSSLTGGYLHENWILVEIEKPPGMSSGAGIIAVSQRRRSWPKLRQRARLTWQGPLL
jgi:hypothetical protein